MVAASDTTTLCLLRATFPGWGRKLVDVATVNVRPMIANEC